MKNQPCARVAIDGLIMADMEEFADYMPEGVVLLPKFLDDTQGDCLCSIDMKATAEANGYRAELKPGTSLYVFDLK